MNKLISESVFTGLLVTALSLPLPAIGQYQDPIDLPAQQLESAKQALQLDVTPAGNRMVSVGERGFVLYTDDQGNSWQQAQVDTRANINAVTFVDAERGWAVGEDQVILATTDGGQSWHRQFDGRDADAKGPLLDVLFKDVQHGLAIGVYSKLLVTDDGGKSWSFEPERFDNPDEWHLFEMASVDENTIYIASEMGLVFVSRDGGASFTPVATGHDGSFHGLLVRKDPSGQDQIAAFGVGGVLYVSLDSGESWSQIETGTQAGLAGGTWLDDGSAVIVGAAGVQVRLSSDLDRVTTHYREDGLPMNAVIETRDGQLLQSGLLGVIKSPLP